MLTQSAVAAQAMDLPPLEAFPWLVRAAPSPSAAHQDGAKTGRGGKNLAIHAGIAMAFAALCGGAFYVASVSFEEPAPAMDLTRLPQGITPAAAPAASGASLAEATTGSEARAQVPQALTRQPGRDGRQTSAAGAQSPADVPSPAPASRITPSLVDAQTFAADAASVTAPPAPPVVDSPATTATLRQYRATIDECRAAIRDVIRLGDRQRPGLRATAEEQTAYRLRQQNAEAAKGYRAYLDTLARSMRGKTSENVARQSLERARQTLGYVNTMLADSQASLR